MSEEPDNPQPSESADQATANRNVKLGDTLLLAVASASAYLFAFNFEVGYTNSFQIPAIFINVGLTSILIMAAKFITLVAFFQPYVNLVVSLTNYFRPNVRPLIGLFAFVATAIAVCIYLMGWENWNVWLIIAAIIVIMDNGISHAYCPPLYTATRHLLRKVGTSSRSRKQQ